MSQLVTVEHNLTQRKFLIAALNKLKIPFTEKGSDQIVIDKAEYLDYNNPVTFNLKTGGVSYDHMHKHTTLVGSIKQHYVEAMHLEDAFQQGHNIVSHTTDSKGNIEILMEGIVAG